VRATLEQLVVVDDRLLGGHLANVSGNSKLPIMAIEISPPLD
jgi:hypothetical protein